MPKILLTPTFERAVKRLHKKQKRVLDDAVREIIADPVGGELKVGDLAGVRVHKFKLNEALMLLAYEYSENQDVIRLLALGSHQNFYLDLKR